MYKITVSIEQDGEYIGSMHGKVGEYDMKTAEAMGVNFLEEVGIALVKECVTELNRTEND